METEYGSWTAADRDLRISYSRAAMESMRRAAMAGLKHVSGAGLEIGGILFGRRDADQIVVEDWREIACEHTEGPSLDLSLTKEAFLNSMLSLIVADPSLSELEIVGWFRTCTKGGVILSGSDVAFFDRQFPEPWQVVLVIRPYVDEPAQAGFFFRDDTGKMQVGASLREFQLENGPTKLPFRIDFRQLPADPKPPARFSPRAVAIIVVTIALFVVLVVPGLPTRRSGADTLPSLQVHDVGGQLVIEWNGIASPDLLARRATLKIFDGPKERAVSLTPEDLRGGCLIYQRLTGDVAIALLLPSSEGSNVSEIARFSGDSPVRVSAPGGGTEDLQEQVRSLRAQLQAETNRSRTLRNAINAESEKPGVGAPERKGNDR